MPGSPAPRAESGGGVLEEAERVMAVAKARLKASSPPQSLADRQRAGMDAHEKQRRALLADAYAKASQDQGEEEDDMEAVMESLEELARTMAQFKELTKQQQERIERGNKLLDTVVDTVTENIPGMEHARKHVDATVKQIRAANSSHLRRQFVMSAMLFALVYLSMKL